MNEPYLRCSGLLACATALLLGACSSARTRYHSLTPIRQPVPASPAVVCSFEPTAPTAAPSHPIRTVLLSHLTVPSSADRMQLRLHQTPTRLSVYETERWAAPLVDQISSILVENLRTALPDLSITSDPLLIDTTTPLRVDMQIEELDALAGKEATVRARWRLSAKDETGARTGTCTAHQPLQSTSVDELVLAWSQALADISSALAAAIQPPANSR